MLTLEEASSRAAAGGKGEGLHRLDAWGLNVPPAYVVSSDAYRDAVSSPEIAGMISLLPSASDSERPATFRAIQAALRSAELPGALTDEIAHAWSALTGGDERHASVSCRSSGTAEDSAAASFAGQFSTVLGLSGVEGIARGIRECWASAWSPEAAAYSRTNGIDVTTVAMAVVVQRMVRADVSGVAFSVNPVTGSHQEVMINASWGLGEVVVSGLVTPDTFLVGKPGLDILVRDISPEKSVRHVTALTGEVVERQVDPVTAMMPCLTDEQVTEVAQMTLRAEAEAGAPQDVEWAYEGAELFVLQTRPVTTV
jgi:pyruvate,water dikinase